MKAPVCLQDLFFILRSDHFFFALVDIADKMFFVSTGWCYLKTWLCEDAALRAMRHVQN